MTVNIFVVGSKPEAVWPDCVPQRVYAANGAIARVQQYLGKAEVTGLVAKSLLKAKPKSRKSSTSMVLCGTRVDRLIVTGGARAKVGFDRPDERKIYATQVEYMSRTFSLCLKMKNRSVRTLYEQARRNRGRWPIVKITHDLVRTRMVSELAISTGVLALLLAFHEARSCEKYRIFLIGVGAEEGGAHFHDNQLQYGGYHVQQDKEMLLDLVQKKNQTCLVLTDPGLQARMADRGRAANRVAKFS